MSIEKPAGPPLVPPRGNKVVDVLDASVLTGEDRDWLANVVVHVRIQFLLPVLGTVPSRNIWQDHVAAKTRRSLVQGTLAGVDKEQQEQLLRAESYAISDDTDKGVTGFYCLDGHPLMLDHQIKGFFKEAAGVLNRAKSEDVGQLKARVASGLFVRPIDYDDVVGEDHRAVLLRRGVWIRPPGEPEGFLDADDLRHEDALLERPLRAEVNGKQQVSIARSWQAPAFSSVEFELRTLAGSGLNMATIRKLLAYGEMQGLGQWRGSGHGRFRTVRLDVVREGKRSKAAKEPKKAAKEPKKAG